MLSDTPERHQLPHQPPPESQPSIDELAADAAEPSESSDAGMYLTLDPEPLTVLMALIDQGGGGGGGGGH